MTAERIGIVDLGSNSARLMVVAIYPDRSYRVVEEAKATVRLAAGLGTDLTLKPEALERTLAALEGFNLICQGRGARLQIPVATAAVRQARNRDEFLAVVRQRTGLAFTVLTEEEEARLGFLGAINTTGVQNGIYLDLGGGSLELVRFAHRRAVLSVSLPYGAVNLTERFLAGRETHPAVAALERFLTESMETVPWLHSRPHLPLLAVGGTVRNLARMDRRLRSYPLDVVHHYQFSPAALEALYQRIRVMEIEERTHLPGLSAERADIIVAGAAAVRAVVRRAQASTIVVSGSGLRDGLLYRYLLGKDGEEDFPDPLEHSVQNLIRLYGLEAERASHLRRLALAVFDTLAAAGHLDPAYRRLAAVAATLADAGVVINYYGSYRHTFYLLVQGRLHSLDHRQKLLCAAAATARPSAKIRQLLVPYRTLLREGDVNLASRLAVVVAAARALARFDPQSVTGLDIRSIPGGLVLSPRGGPRSLAPEARELVQLAAAFRRAFNCRAKVRL